MTSIHDAYADLLDADATETGHGLIAALDHVYTRAWLPPAADDAVLAAIHHPPASCASHEYRRGFQLSLAALVPASLLLLGIAAVVSLRASSPTSVSAESILHRAAAVHPSPNRALHLVYRETYYQTSIPRQLADTSGNDDIWAEYDPHGNISHFANTDVESTQGITTGIQRCVGGRTVERCYDYEPASKVLHKPFTITRTESLRDAGPLRGVDMLNGTGVARLLTRLMHHSSAGVRLLPERRLNGVLVYPIRVRLHVQSSGPQPTIIYYFDAHTYILRGMSVLPPRAPGFADVGAQDTVLVKRETVPLRAVPAGTFQLRLPTGNQVWVVIP